MLITESSFKITLIDIEQVRSTLEYIEDLEGSSIRLQLISQSKEEVVFVIKQKQESTFKTIPQWFLESDFKDVLETLQIKKEGLTYVDEDALEGYVLELNTKSLWDGNRIIIKKGFWICGK